MRPEELVFVQHFGQDAAQSRFVEEGEQDWPCLADLAPPAKQCLGDCGMTIRKSTALSTRSGNSVRTEAGMTVAAANGISPTTERTFSGTALPSGRRRTS